jgi:hypothetical protein
MLLVHLSDQQCLSGISHTHFTELSGVFKLGIAPQPSIKLLFFFPFLTFLFFRSTNRQQADPAAQQPFKFANETVTA